jgi:hypothetical protein
LALLLLALAPRITGFLPHEIVGALFFLLLAIHLIVNRGWFRVLFKGRYGLRRAINALVVISLILGLVSVLISGIINSKHVFAFLDLEGTMRIRTTHTGGAYWGIVLVGLHMGLQWHKVGVRLKRIKWASRHWWLLRGLALLMAAMGICGMFMRDMWPKLFLGHSFDFWDPGRPVALFFFLNLGIVALFAVIAHQARRIPLPWGKGASAAGRAGGRGDADGAEGAGGEGGSTGKD